MFLILFTLCLSLGQCAIKTGANNTEHCGNGLIEANYGEECDDLNLIPGDGCGVQCQVERGYECPRNTEPSECSLVIGGPTCGNGKKSNSEECDDANRNSGDGCTENCFLEPGFYCTTRQNQ